MFNQIKYDEILADRLINHSCKIKPKEKVLISYNDCPHTIIELLIEKITEKQATPIVFQLDRNIKRRLLLTVKDDDLDYYRKIVEPIMSSADAVILISGSNNDFEFSDIPAETFASFSKLYVEPIHFKIRCSKKWVLLRYPTPAFAQNSHMSSEKFYEHYYKVCTIDYSKLDEKMNPLKSLMDKTDKVRIVAPNTDLTFSIKDMPTIKCSGQSNIPDGEIYTAPIKNSVNGFITFNIPAIDNGVELNNIYLKFQDGKIIDFNCNNREKFEEILNTDDGSRYLGEFAFGLNPYCTNYVKDILFDEKMTSSIHLAIGSSYEDCFNGNTSAVHLDLIQSHLEQYGGGKIYFDDALIYENGKFIYPNLVALNSENLI